MTHRYRGGRYTFRPGNCPYWTRRIVFASAQ